MARNLLITILNGAKEKLTKSADASSAPVKVEPSYKVRPRLPIMAELDGRELMEKAREGLTTKQIQVTRKGKTFTQTVYVRAGEKAEGKAGAGQHPIHSHKTFNEDNVKKIRDKLTSPWHDVTYAHTQMAADKAMYDHIKKVAVNSGMSEEQINQTLQGTVDSHEAHRRLAAELAAKEPKSEETYATSLSAAHGVKEKLAQMSIAGVSVRPVYGEKYVVLTASDAAKLKAITGKTPSSSALHGFTATLTLSDAKKFITGAASEEKKPEAKDEGRDISAEKKAAVMQLRDVKSVVGGVFKKHGVDTSKINFGSFIEKRAGSATEEPSIWADVPNKYVADIKSELDKRGHAHRTVELSGDRTRFMVNNKPDAPKEEAKTVDTTAPAGKEGEASTEKAGVKHWERVASAFTIRQPNGSLSKVSLINLSQNRGGANDEGEHAVQTTFHVKGQTHKPQVKKFATRKEAIADMQHSIDVIRKGAPENKITVHHSELK